MATEVGFDVPARRGLSFGESDHALVGWVAARPLLDACVRTTRS
jgi:hypothetical protein